MVHPHKTVLIANGGTVSAAVQTNGLLATAILLPAAMTGANLSFQAHDGAGNYKAVNGISIALTVSNWMPLTLDQSIAIGEDFKIVSDGAEGAERSLKVMVRGV